MLLSGAFVSSVVASITANPWLGVIAAVIVGGLLAWVLAVLAIRYVVNQIIAGTVINLFAAGMTSFLYSRVLAGNPTSTCHPPRPDRDPDPVRPADRWADPVRRQLLRLRRLRARDRHPLRPLPHPLRPAGRSVGEHPRAADTVGINVNFTRYRNVILAGWWPAWAGPTSRSAPPARSSRG